MTALFPTAVYGLCFGTSALCAGFLGRMFARTGTRLLFWSSACFVMLSLNNLVVVFDMLIFPTIYFRLVRLGLSLIAISLLLFGFIWDNE